MKLSRIVTRTSSLSAAVLALFAAVGCGNGGSTNIIHTTGNYSKASLNGTYVYEVQGDSVSGPYREIGAFTADGAGNVTAGSDDSSLSPGTAPFSYTGQYSVGNDGTGFISLGNRVLGQITLALTVVSSSKVDLMEADNFADGAGVAKLQTASAAGSAPSGTFVFRLHEFASVESASESASEVGAVTISSGNVTGAAVDQNLGGVSNQFNLTGGAFGAPAVGSMGRGTATISGSSSFSRGLIYYIVDSGKLTLLVSNANAIGSGEAEAQSGAVSNGLSGNYAFGSRGDDPFPNGFPNLSAMVGSFSAGGGSISTYNFDAMQDGTYSNGTTMGSTSSPSSNGRVVVTLSSGSPEVFWMVNPSRAFFSITSANDVEDGTADLQTVNSFATSTMNGQFAMVMDGIDLNVGQDLARIGPLQFDGSGKLSLAELVNASSSGNGAQPPLGGGLTGSYQVDSATGRIGGTVSNSSVTPLDLAMYAVSGSDAYVLQTDGGLVTSGTVSLQH